MEFSHFKSSHPRSLAGVSFVALLTFGLSTTNVLAEGQQAAIEVDGITTIYADASESTLRKGPGPFDTIDGRLAVPAAQWNDSAAPDPKDDGPASAADRVAGKTAGGTATPGAKELARNDFAEAWRYIEEQERAQVETREAGASRDGTHGVFTRYAGNLNTQSWQSAPWRKIGKLYFTKPNGSNSYCTANVVSSNSIIATAAHCIYTRGQGFNRNFRFVPAERYGAAPYGSFSWSSASVANGWIGTGGRRHDLGLVRLRNNASNRSVVSYVGWLGRAWNQSYTKLLHSVGYPTNLSSQYTNICAAQSFFSPTEGADVLVKGCDMTFGSSGGGWLMNYRPYSNGGNHVNGVVSGPHIGAFGNTYVGPRFSSANIVALCNIQGC